MNLSENEKYNSSRKRYYGQRNRALFRPIWFRCSFGWFERRGLKDSNRKNRENLERQVNKGLLTAEDKAAALGRIQPFTDLGVALTSADLVVEAATENQDLKAKIFQQMDAAAPVHCILATNTSSLSITTLASYTQRPEKVIGMHFMNPVPVMRLVEIIKGYQTDEATLATIEDLTRTIEKVPLVAADYPGFVANRILLPMINGNRNLVSRSWNGRSHRWNDEIGYGSPHGTFAFSRFYRSRRVFVGARGASQWFWERQVCALPIVAQHGRSGQPWR